MIYPATGPQGGISLLDVNSSTVGLDTFKILDTSQESLYGVSGALNGGILINDDDSKLVPTAGYRFFFSTAKYVLDTYEFTFSDIENSTDREIGIIVPDLDGKLTPVKFYYNPYYKLATIIKSFIIVEYNPNAAGTPLDPFYSTSLGSPTIDDQQFLAEVGFFTPSGVFDPSMYPPKERRSTGFFKIVCGNPNISKIRLAISFQSQGTYQDRLDAFYFGTTLSTSIPIVDEFTYYDTIETYPNFRKIRTINSDIGDIYDKPDLDYIIPNIYYYFHFRTENPYPTPLFTGVSYNQFKINEMYISF